MNQSEFLAIISNLLKARENSRAPGAIGSNLVLHGFGFCRLENLFTPVTKYSDCNRKITVIRRLRFPTELIPSYKGTG